MTSEGVPKVTDFGIARSVSADTATMKIETVGSVHYSSPEQVRGGYTDEQSDIYSIGITIFEMITGKLPFDGETPVAVALKHIQDEPPVPSTLKPGIPKALDYIILKAIAKNKQDRYANVTELINDLENIRSKQGAGQGLVLPNIKRENDKYNTKKFAPLGDEDLKKRQPARDADSPEEKENSSSRKYMPFIYVLLITTIVGGIFYFVSAILKDILPKPEERPKEIILGTYIARDIDEVLKELEQDGITPVIHEEPSDSVEKNVIIKQKPDPDISFKVGGMTPLELWVSTGEETVTIPTVKHQDFNTMKFKLQDELGLDVVVKEEYSEEIPSNLCTRSEPDANTVVNKGSKVTLYRSLGPEKKQVVVPNLSNLTYDEAVNKLLSEKLKLGNTYPLGREGYQGKIIDQAPKAGETVTEDSAVDIFFEEEGSSGDETPGGNSKTIKINLPQGGGYNFGDTVRLRAFVVDHATGEELQILNEPNFPVSEFPRSLVVSVPATGGVTIKVYINDLLVNEESF